MNCMINEVFKEVKCPFCNQHQQSIVHNLTIDENTVVLPLRDPNKIKKFISNMFLVMSIEDEDVDNQLFDSSKKLFLEESESKEMELNLSDFNINTDE